MEGIRGIAYCMDHPWCPPEENVCGDTASEMSPKRNVERLRNGGHVMQARFSDPRFAGNAEARSFVAVEDSRTKPPVLKTEAVATCKFRPRLEGLVSPQSVTVPVVAIQTPDETDRAPDPLLA